MAELSTGCLEYIMAGVNYDKPILQILVVTKFSDTCGNERHQLVVSDGKNVNNSAMLATQLNELCTQGKLVEHTIIRVDRYSTSGEGDKRVFTILELTVLYHGSIVGKLIANTGDSSSSKRPVANNTGSVRNCTPPSTSDNTRSYSHNNSMPRQAIGQSNILSIASLNKWVIKARVVFKSEIRPWSKGEGRLFSMDLKDESGEIRATAFNEQCDKFYDMIEVDKVYFISKCKLNPANKQYNKTDNYYEMFFTNESEVHLCTDDEAQAVATQRNASLSQPEPSRQDPTPGTSSALPPQAGNKRKSSSTEQLTTAQCAKIFIKVLKKAVKDKEMRNNKKTLGGSEENELQLSSDSD